MSMQNNQGIRTNESGVASIVVSMIIMVVLTLTTIGFARLMSREYRQAVDNQLSVQAFYAAEAAVNKVASLAASGTIPPSTDCVTPDTDYQLEGTTVAASCVLVNENTTTLTFNNGNERDSSVFSLKGFGGTSIGVVEFTWSALGSNVGLSIPSDAISGSHQLLSYKDWNDAQYANILRVNFVPFVSGMTGDDLYNRDRTYFLYPTDEVTVPQIMSSAATNGQYVDAACQAASPGTPVRCTARINLSEFNANQFYFRVKGIYSAAGFDVTAFANPGDTTPMTLDNGQLSIDATGQANDILRRIRVTVGSAAETVSIPEYGIETTHGICKRLLVNQVNSLTTDECQTPTSYY